MTRCNEKVEREKKTTLIFLTPSCITCIQVVWRMPSWNVKLDRSFVILFFFLKSWLIVNFTSAIHNRLDGVIGNFDSVYEGERRSREREGWRDECWRRAQWRRREGIKVDTVNWLEAEKRRRKRKKRRRIRRKMNRDLGMRWGRKNCSSKAIQACCSRPLSWLPSSTCCTSFDVLSTYLRRNKKIRKMSAAAETLIGHVADINSIKWWTTKIDSSFIPPSLPSWHTFADPITSFIEQSSKCLAIFFFPLCRVHPKSICYHWRPR